MNDMKVGIITASDKGSNGLRTDESGPAIARIMEQHGAQILALEILPDDKQILSEAMIRMADVLACDVILTTGGTGFSKRDVTPEATIAICDRIAPGIAEAMRAESLKITNRAMLSRAAAGIRGATLIINLPGSPKGATECLNIVLPVLPHAVEILRGGGECAVPVTP
jgi:molybdopterin adenylyltransferase